MESLKQTKSDQTIIDKSRFDLEELKKFRRWMHQNAELSFEEFNTKNKILEFLKNSGIDSSQIRELAKTGLIVTLKGKAEPKGEPFTIALRADMDALPMKECSNHEYKTVTNAAHLCGHDGHTTCVLGALSLIQAKLEVIPSNKTVKLFFQPAEENYGGAHQIVKEGGLEGVDEIYGMHNYPTRLPELKGVKILVKGGDFMSECVEVRIKVKNTKFKNTSTQTHRILIFFR